MLFSARNVAPCVVTGAGLGLGLAGVVMWGSWLAVAYLVASLLVDVVDGRLARRLGATSEVGGEFDRTVDTGIAFALAWRALPVAIAAHLALVFVQVWARVTGARASGRAAVTIGAIAWWAFGR